MKSGYAGGVTPNPTYEEVSNGDSGYIEAIQIEFDKKIVSFVTLLEIFFKTHDPTSFDRQGADAGPQYRSVVFGHNADQLTITKDLINKMNESNIFPKPIVTEVRDFTTFWEAEPYHRNFYKRNEDYPYCEIVIKPKLNKFFKEFSTFAINSHLHHKE